ncbi:MAG: hypothetical protein AAB420_02170 [Patescibacteria group bacterium]
MKTHKKSPIRRYVQDAGKLEELERDLQRVEDPATPEEDRNRILSKFQEIFEIEAFTFKRVAELAREAIATSRRRMLLLQLVEGMDVIIRGVSRPVRVLALDRHKGLLLVKRPGKLTWVSPEEINNIILTS